MSACTFFGHRECPSELRDKLRTTIVDLIENHGIDFFYVGNQGQFDAMARNLLQEMETMSYQIEYAIVLAYMPLKTHKTEDFTDTMLPEGIEQIPKRFAISWRNSWMLKHSDYVVAYVTHSWGGAAKYMEMAIRQKKMVINLADTEKATSPLPFSEKYGIINY